MKNLIWLMCICVGLEAKGNLKALQNSGVKVEVNGKEIHIEREIDPKCMDLHILPEQVYSGDFANPNTPKECQKSFITTLGVIQPMQLDPKIETVAELEVMHFIKTAQQEPQNYVLVDARKAAWFEQMTIPTAVNLPFNEIAYDPDFKEDFEKMLKMLGIVKNGDTLDFTNAKTALLFCNGPWCGQSHMAMDQLIKLGFPKEKLKWYRGGLQDWLVNGFTVLKNH